MTDQCPHTDVFLLPERPNRIKCAQCGNEAEITQKEAEGLIARAHDLAFAASAKQQTAAPRNSAPLFTRHIGSVTYQGTAEDLQRWGFKAPIRPGCIDCRAPMGTAHARTCPEEGIVTPEQTVETSHA